MVRLNRLRWTKIRECDGAAMVEFAIGCTVLIMLLLGIVEFGFLYYQKQVVTNASREAARYAVTYRTKTDGTRLAPKNFTNPTITEVVNTYCTGRIPTGSWTIGALGGTAVYAALLNASCALISLPRPAYARPRPRLMVGAW